MKSYLFIGGSYDGLNASVPTDEDTVKLSRHITESETYIRDSLSVGDHTVTISPGNGKRPISMDRVQ